MSKDRRRGLPDEPNAALIEATRDRIRDHHLSDDRPASSARGLHHVALLSGDVERTA